MDRRTIGLVFRKDGLELLRDRRTLFVNVVLPVLLYPLLALLAIQVLQLTRPTAADLPRVAVFGAAEGLLRHLPAPNEASEASEELEQTVAASALDAAEAAAWQELFRPWEEGAQASPAARDAALQRLRAAGLAAVGRVEERPGSGGPAFVLTLLVDDAHRDSEQVQQALRQGLDRLRDSLLAERLLRLELKQDFLTPTSQRSIRLAPTGETLRARLAGAIPVLLVLMALSGAFYPALDLIAGERERGTLESLLSWPGDRRSIFLGKLAVVVVAAIVSVILNLCSLGLTTAIAGQHLGGGGTDLTGGLAVGAGVLALCFVGLLPLVILLAAVSLALAGLAASYKEAQNYLSPLFIAVMVPAMLALAPNASASLALDLVPIIGPVLALKESLQSPHPAWGHLLLATAASSTITLVVVAWAVRLLEEERFLFPGLVRAGWGRWRVWGRRPTVPTGLEAIGVFAVATGAFLFLGPLAAKFGPVAMFAVPLIACIALPALLHCWAGAYQPAACLGLRRPRPRACLAALLLIVPLAGLGLSIGVLQGHLLGEMPTPPVSLEVLERLAALGGLPLLLLVLAVTPGICEELLCRGTLLSGLRRSLGPVMAVLVSSFCFAVLHGSPWRLLPQAMAGIVLALLCLRSGSILPAMLLHAGHNGFLFLLAWSWPGFEPLLREAPQWLWLAILPTAGLLIWPLLHLASKPMHATPSEVPAGIAASNPPTGA